MTNKEKKLTAHKSLVLRAYRPTNKGGHEMTQKIMGMTIQEIRALNPCGAYTPEVLEALRRAVCGRRRVVTLLDVIKSDIPTYDKLWLVLRNQYLTDRQLHEVAIWCWEEIARPVWEQRYPNDKIPHEAIRVKRLWLDGTATDEELEAAWAAAREAAGEAARAAAWEAAWAAAREAARAAAWAAAREAAWEAAWAAAREAARAAAWAAAGEAAREAAREAAWEAARAAAWAAAGEAARAAAGEAAREALDEEPRGAVKAAIREKMLAHLLR